MVDIALAPWTPYMPSVGPAIEKIHNDLYGISFIQGRSVAPTNSFVGVEPPDWTQVWKTRTVSEWAALAQEYNFRYVISPNNVPLQLPKAIEGPGETLYSLP